MSGLGADDDFPLDFDELTALIQNPMDFTGAAKHQTEEFLEEVVDPILEKYKDLIGKTDSIINV